jgi:hypothetical protein
MDTRRPIRYWCTFTVDSKGVISSEHPKEDQEAMDALWKDGVRPTDMVAAHKCPVCNGGGVPPLVLNIRCHACQCTGIVWSKP